MRKVANHYLYLNDLEYIKKKTGRVVGIMHSLPRNDFEFEQSLDKSEFELYFKQIGFSIPLRMALLRVYLRRELALYGRCGAVFGGLPPWHVSVRPASGPVAISSGSFLSISRWGHVPGPAIGRSRHADTQGRSYRHRGKFAHPQ